MSVLRAVCVDDEPLALRRMAHAISGSPVLELAGSAGDACEALGLIEDARPDLLFLDIRMPGMSGFDLVERLDPARAPVVIFVTAYDEYAIRAFEVNAVDYLLKPVAMDRLRQAADRARAVIDARLNERRVTELQGVIRGMRSEQSALGQSASDAMEAFLWVHRNRAWVRLPLSEIRWFEADRDYVKVHAASGVGLMRETMNSLAGRLDPELFIRVHRSAIVARGRIRELRRKPNSTLALSLVEGVEIPVGRRYARGLRELVGRIDDAGG